jgi:tetratricopeptide (TPR) repeat protein
VAQSLNNLAAVLLREGKPAEAEKIARRSLSIVEKAMGPEHVGIAANLTTLAQIEMARGQYRDAENSFKRSLVLTEKNLGPENPTLALVLMPYASLLRKTGRTTEAGELEARARKVMAKVPRHDVTPPR